MILSTMPPLCSPYYFVWDLPPVISIIQYPTYRSRKDSLSELALVMAISASL